MRVTGLTMSRNSVAQSRNRSSTRQSIDNVVKLGISKLKKGEIKQFADVGLSNSLVLRYIHEIYEEYSIEDPLNADGQVSIQNTPPSRSVRHSFDSSRQSVVLSRVDKLKKSIRQELQRTAVESEQGLSRLHRVRQQTPGPLLTSRFESQSPTTHFFRFCLVCQSMIEHHNILQHEKTCEGFQLLYTMSPEQVVQYLKTKIQRYEGAVINALRIREEFNEQPVYQFLKQVNQRKLGDIETSYLRVVQSLPTKSLKILELCYKLKWFRKVLEQFQIKAGFA